ncbi:hypothetical protein F5B22DRAFT_520589 [Xylaria bambusicola]|uniref:uncharacterized protein n=1 Tax=Xylaria bambusicola TaxID=326684 RepID=UPI002007505A|nr:uncharacterized protein F5B22DRAFT_520589 [Xylaria bambusicola]KAI0505573.1 hypothetical protein F5B22DRAFT_520589 [Xylaria bambusicola]
MATSARYFNNPTTPLKKVDAHSELIASLRRIVKLHPPIHTCSTSWSFSGLYSGPTSIAFLFYRLSGVYPNFEYEHQSLLEWAEAYLQLGARTQKRTPTPGHCGVGNETLAHLALKSILSEDATLVRELCSYAEAINSSTEDGSNEWLYGRAGYLYLMRLCHEVFSEVHHPGTAALLQRTIESTANRILKTPPPWVWHGKHYIGAAHGSISIITQVVLSIPSMARQLQPLLVELLDSQFPSGNFPSSLPAGSDRLVQFCHGGPGIVISLRTLLPFFPEVSERIDRAIRAAQVNIWEKGLLTKEPCICHGIAGNSLALDKDDQYLHFLSFMDSERIQRLLQDSSRDNSTVGLYTGESGRAWCWAVAHKGLPRTCIGYNDI